MLLFTNIFFVNLILSVFIVFFQRRDPKAVWTWLLALYFFPVFGIFLYLLFGQDMRKSRMFRIKEVEDSLEYPAKRQEIFMEGRDDAVLSGLSGKYRELARYNLELSGAVLTANNRVDVFTDGRDKFADLAREIGAARQYIHIQYYIIKNDQVFDGLMPLLIKKRREGVEVRILCDGMGGRFMPAGRWRELTEAGIAVAMFFPPFLGRLNFRVNYRNHRKIVVIDGAVGYVGGFNVGREYISAHPRFGHWRDTHLKITGEAAVALEIRFALDWNYAAGENLFKRPEYFGGGRISMEKRKETYGNVGIQIVSSGPDTSERQIRDNYLGLIYRAKEHIYIQTPYFVPDDAVLSALKIAARSGVDVRLMIPCKPDHPFVYWATYSYMGDLLDAGAKCYVYENGFLHSKYLTVDGEAACCGTANMDIRSFELNFEVNAVIYDADTTGKLEQAFLGDIPVSREITPEVYRARSLWVRVKEQGSRLLSPLL